MALPLAVKNAARRIWDNLGFVCVAGVLIYCVIHAFDPPRLNWGDSMSDYNVMTAGRNFAKYGFLKMRLTPILLDPAYQRSFEPAFIYTHYPQLPDLTNGVLRVVFHMHELWQFRLVAIGFSFAALFFIYQLLRSYWGRQTAQIALALWVVNPLWIQHADYLHHAPLGAFFGFGSVYLALRYLREERRRFLVASGVFLFFTVLASYDMWFFVPLLLAMVTMHHHRKLVSWPIVRTLGFLALFAIAAVTFKFATNAWALGGVGPWLHDLRFQYTERGTDKITRTHYGHGALPTMYGRVERFFTLLLFPIVLFWALRPLIRRRWGNSFPQAFTAPNPWWLFAAACPFLVIFTEVWVGQYYPTLLVIPFYAVACASFAAILLTSDARARLVGVVLVLGLLLNSLGENYSFKKAFFREDEIASLRAHLDSLEGPGQQVLFNTVFDAAYRYYFNRNTVALILFPPGPSNIVLATYSDEKQRPRAAGPNGTVYVHHNHLTDELYDKGYYYIFGRYGLWRLWGNPEKYRKAVDEIIAQRDSIIMANVQRMGTKVVETPDYSIWKIPPQPSEGTTAQR